MKITAIRFYDGAREKVCRLGLADLFLELQQIIFETRVEIEEKSEANGAAVVREALDRRFESGADWVKTTTGGIDWVKRIRYNATFMARLGVEIQVSARSDLLKKGFPPDSPSGGNCFTEGVEEHRFQLCNR